MRNLVIFTDVGGDSDDTLMLIMARHAHMRGECNVLGVVCAGTHDNYASSTYAHWLMNPQWIEIPVIADPGMLSLPEIYPTPSYPPIQSEHKMFGMLADRLAKLDEPLTYLVCSPTTAVPRLLGTLGFSSGQRTGRLLRPSCSPVKLILMGMLNEDGTPNFEKAYNLRADSEATEAMFHAIERGEMVIDMVVDRDECYQYPITSNFWFNSNYGSGRRNPLMKHYELLVKRNLRIVEKELPDVWERVYKDSETMATPYDAVTFWKAVYPGEGLEIFWNRLREAMDDHPRSV